MTNSKAGIDNFLSTTSFELDGSEFFNKINQNLHQKKQVSIKPAGRLFTEILATLLQKKGFSPIILISENEDDIFYAREELETISGKKAGLFYSFTEEESINLDEIEEIIRPAGFYKQKASYLISLTEFLLKTKGIPYSP